MHLVAKSDNAPILHAWGGRSISFLDSSAYSGFRHSISSKFYLVKLKISVNLV